MSRVDLEIIGARLERAQPFLGLVKSGHEDDRTFLHCTTDMNLDLDRHTAITLADHEIYIT